MSLRRAIEHAQKNPILPRGRNSISRFASVLCDVGGHSVVGLNSYKTSPLQARFASNPECIHIHSEISAIQNAIRYLARHNGFHYRDVTDLSGWSMFVARVLKDGTPAMAMPCDGCQRALSAFNISKVEWTVSPQQSFIAQL